MELIEQKNSLTPSSSDEPCMPREAWLAAHRGGLSPMDRLFNQFDGMYPNRWRAAFASEQAIGNWRAAWAQAFAEERLTLAGVATALRACRKTHDWPPSLPEFLRLCVLTVEPESAFHEAVRQMFMRHNGGGDQWSHPAIFWAAAEFGTHDLKSTPYTRAAARWGRILAAKMVTKCEPIPVARLALPAPGDTTPDAEAVSRLLAGARALIKRFGDQCVKRSVNA